MAFFAGYTALHRLNRYFRPIFSVPAHTDRLPGLFCVFCPSCNGNRRLSANAQSTPSEFIGHSAYELLGVSKTSSFSEIKASFRKLAKETHPDLAHSQTDSSASKQFIEILAAYEILSDSERRAHYDQYLFSRRALVQKQARQGSIMYKYESHRLMEREMEVVEWLKWYRYTINDIVSEKRVVVGSGYFDVLERDFYSAIHAAFYGPEIESMDLLPECFEAEERSISVTPDILHLVSGRDLFGMVRVANRNPELSHTYTEKLTSFESDLCFSINNVSTEMNSNATVNGSCQKQSKSINYFERDAYKDLELHVSGKVVAIASRVRPKSNSNLAQDKNAEDLIHIYLTNHEDATYKSDCVYVPVGSRILLGTIHGMGTSPEEGSCDVYDHNGVNTHVIMKHRTLLVKHMHWYQVGDEVSVCECRCSRARLPPSKFWLFEPRCGMHDIGGWYVETFGRDKKSRNVPSQRYWDGLDANDHFDKRLHPAMYLLALAYRTLDIEDARLQKRRMKDIVEDKMHRILSWCKTLVSGM
ncbi:PREDICTED: uncharacterized protein LOC109189072 [Ipomoea nil]|uniref:uncharacterized protein LOC109189072 n=1 Tax=Ipomoea nil TaxID=35883 RepID=UPI0009015CFA|nr:PREDICTED: uncharacterized protein LOC109189072 [Ipomoea nil]